MPLEMNANRLSLSSQVFLKLFLFHHANQRAGKGSRDLMASEFHFTVPCSAIRLANLADGADVRIV